MLALVPHIGNYAADPVDHLAHAEVLLDQRLLMILLDPIQFDSQDLIILLFVILECVRPHRIQFALKQKI